MNSIPQIDYWKKRDAGQTLTLSFQFIRLYFKPLMKAVFSISFPFFGFAAFLIGAFFSAFFVSMQNLGAGAGSSDMIVLNLLMLLLGFLFLMIGSILMTNSINEFITYVYENNGKAPGLKDIWKPTIRQFLATFADYLILSILNSFIFVPIQYTVGFFAAFLVMIVGSGLAFFAILGTVIFCVLMIFMSAYFYAATMPQFFIQSFEKKKVLEGLGRSIQLMHKTKRNFWGAIWTNLLAGVCMYALYNMLTPIIGLVFYLLSQYSGFQLEDQESIMYVISIVYGILILVAPLPFIVYFVAIAMRYFDMVQDGEGRGYKLMIPKIGEIKDFDVQSYEQG